MLLLKCSFEPEGWGLYPRNGKPKAGRSQGTLHTWVPRELYASYKEVREIMRKKKKDFYLVQTFVILGELSLTDELILINLTYDANHSFIPSFNNYLLKI